MMATLLTACRVAHVLRFTHWHVIDWSALCLDGRVVLEGQMGFDLKLLADKLLLLMLVNVLVNS